MTSPLRRAPPGVKRPFLSKKCIFRAENDIFSKSSFYTNMFSDPKYSFSVCQKYFFVISKKVNIFLLSQKKLIFFTELNLIMPIYHTPLQLRLILSFRRYKCLFSISSFDCCVVHNPTVFLRGYKSTPNVFIFGHLYQVNTREFFTSEWGPCL